jgi:hypothetical protein
MIMSAFQLPARFGAKKIEMMSVNRTLYSTLYLLWLGRLFWGRVCKEYYSKLLQAVS